jgi:hypothetical protein
VSRQKEEHTMIDKTCPNCLGERKIEIEIPWKPWIDPDFYASGPETRLVTCPDCEGRGEIVVWCNVGRCREEAVRFVDNEALCEEHAAEAEAYAAAEEDAAAFCPHIPELTCLDQRLADWRCAVDIGGARIGQTGAVS